MNQAPSLMETTPGRCARCAREVESRPGVERCAPPDRRRSRGRRRRRWMIQTSLGVGLSEARLIAVDRVRGRATSASPDAGDIADRSRPSDPGRNRRDRAEAVRIGAGRQGHRVDHLDPDEGAERMALRVADLAGERDRVVGRGQAGEPMRAERVEVVDRVARQLAQPLPLGSGRCSPRSRGGAPGRRRCRGRSGTRRLVRSPAS
mgnify:CR=1 FL=1